MNAVEAPRQEPTGTTATYKIHGRWLLIARITWLLVAALAMILFALSVPARFEQLLEFHSAIRPEWEQIGLSPEFVAAIALMINLIGTSVFTAVAVLLFVRKSDNWLVLLTSMMLLGFGVGTINSGMYALTATHPDLRVPVELLQIIGHIGFVAFVYTFPDGKFTSKWAPIVIITWSSTLVLAYFVPNLQIGAIGIWQIVTFMSLVVYALGVVSQRQRRHLLTQSQLQQRKWVLIGLSIALIGYLVWVIPNLLPFEHSGPLWRLFDIYSEGVMVFSSAAVPVTIGASMLRYKLWEVDFYISRGLTYAAMTIILLFLFAVDLAGLQVLLRLILGPEYIGPALVGAAMIYGAFFMPMRNWLQRKVDRYVYGIKLNLQKAAKVSVQPEQVSAKAHETSIGPYADVSLIARGGMAEVYKANHPTLGRDVAIKVLSPDLATDEGFRRRFEREAKTVATLKHPNIVTVFDFGMSGDTYYMVMEYIAGKTLAEHMREQGPMPLNEVLWITRDIANALDYAHSQGVIHRDVKPSNVMLEPLTSPQGDKHYRAVLTDFGIAKMAAGTSTLTGTGLLGTFDYIAPEQIKAASKVDERADIYSLGVIVYQMLTGHLPFEGSNPAVVIFAHLQQPPPDPREYRPDLPESVSQVLSKALAKDPDERYQSAGELADDLEYALKAMEAQ